jgi:ATP synthase mitochondrial F1 complex assembly factor 2
LLLNTDDLSFYEEYPPQLVKLQEAHWDPLHSWTEKQFGVKVAKFNSVLLNTQPSKTREVLSEELRKMDMWQLAGES